LPSLDDERALKRFLRSAHWGDRRILELPDLGTYMGKSERQVKTEASRVTRAGLQGGLLSPPIRRRPRDQISVRVFIAVEQVGRRWGRVKLVV